MVEPNQRSAGSRGLFFLGCFIAAPLIGVAIGMLGGARDLALILSAVALPAVLMMGYGLWHLQRIVRVIRLRLGGAPRVDDDPVAEHAAGSFMAAGWVVAALVLVGFLIVGRAGHGVALAVAALGYAVALGRAARSGRLPAPEFE